MVPDDTFAILSDIADTADSRAGNPGHSQRVTSYVSALLPALHVGVEESRLIIAAARLRLLSYSAMWVDST